MYADSLYFLLLILGGVALITLLTGLILSILVFNTKSRAMEIIAWICGGLWFLLYLAMAIAYSNTFDAGRTSDYFLYPALVIFFLLLQYRSNTAAGNNLKILYVAKSVMIVLMLFTLHSQFFNLFIETGYFGYDNTIFMRVIPIVGAIISVAVMTYVTFKYLVRINALAEKNEVFKNAILFTGTTYLIADVLSHILFFIRYARSIPVMSFFNVTVLSMQFIYFIVESLVAAGIAAAIYKSKQEANPVQVKE